MGESRERDLSTNATSFGRGGVVHATALSGLRRYHVLYCNGRSMGALIGTTEPPTCKSCLDKLAREMAAAHA
jgi:hypothetical protein